MDNPDAGLEIRPGSDARIDKLQTFADFSDPSGVYLLVAMARKKENEHISRNTELMSRKVCAEKEDIPLNIRKLKAEISVHDGVFRLYMSANRRDSRRGAHLLRSRINRWQEQLLHGEEHEGARKMMRRTGSKFRSCLQKPACKQEKHFIIDLDETGSEHFIEASKALQEVTNVLLTTRTPNGYHFVVDGFDPTTFHVDGDYEIKQDDMFFVGYL